ncbi:MAG: hypothetical protein WHX53_11655 [Anaerolineae bacterium]
MSSRTNQLPKSNKTDVAPSQQRRLLPIFAIVAALLLIAVGVMLARRTGAPAGAAAGTPAVVNAPRLAVDRTLIDFGKVPLDVPVRATFRLSNVGDRPLQILKQPVVEVKAGC